TVVEIQDLPSSNTNRARSFSQNGECVEPEQVDFEEAKFLSVLFVYPERWERVTVLLPVERANFTERYLRTVNHPCCVSTLVPDLPFETTTEKEVGEFVGDFFCFWELFEGVFECECCTGIS